MSAVIGIEGIFKQCKSIAIVGLSPKVDRDSHQVARYLLDQGYGIVPIHPHADEILGCRVYRHLQEVPVKIEVVNVFVNTSLVEGVVEDVIERQASHKDVQVVWSQLGIDSQAYDRLPSGIALIKDKCIKIEHQMLYGKSSDTMSCNL